VAVAFKYRASTAEGRLVDGVVQAGSQAAAAEELRRQRLVPVTLEAVSDAARGRAGRRRWLGRSDVALFARTLATLLSAGIPLDRALAFTGDDTADAALGAALAQVRRDVEAGASLAVALERHPRLFSPVVVAMVMAGEESGALDQVVARLADHLEEARELRAQLRTALLYPSLMGVAAGGGIAVLLLFVVPRFVTMIAEVGGTLPLSTRLLVAASGLVVGWWWLWLLVLAVGGYAARRWVQDPAHRVRWHAWRLGVPVAGELERSYAAARFLRTLGILLGSGMPAVSAIRTAATAVSNAALARLLGEGAAAVSRGERVSAAVGGALPTLAVQLLAAGEESGTLDALALRAADTYDAEVRRATRALVALVEPATILLFGVIVGFIALAMLQAVYGVNGAGAGL
jgi:type II secretory pathway component PulF